VTALLLGSSFIPDDIIVSTFAPSSFRSARSRALSDPPFPFISIIFSTFFLRPHAPYFFGVLFWLTPEVFALKRTVPFLVIPWKAAPDL